MGNQIDISHVILDESNRNEQTFTFSNNPSGIYIRPDLSKLVIIGNSASMSNKPFYSIYDIQTNKQSQTKVNPDQSIPLKGAYCFGYFDENDTTLQFCIGVWSKKIFYVNTNTGLYNEKLVNPEGVSGNTEIENILKANSIRYKNKLNGYSFNINNDEKENEYYINILAPSNKNVSKINHTSIIRRAYFMYKLSNNLSYTVKEILLICGYIRTIEK
eukprot:451248_1